MSKKQFLIAALSAILMSNFGHVFADTTTITNEPILGPSFYNTLKDLDVQTLLEDYVEINGGVGGAVCLIDEGQIQYYVYGNQSLTSNEPITEDTVFELGSMSKIFTTLALIDLIGKGEMQLDDPIDMYLPGVTIPEFEGQKITLRQLATHSSGLPRMPDNINPQNVANPYADYTPEQLYEFLSKYTLQKAPGSSFEYSNTGMGLLGHVLSVHSQKSYDELIQGVASTLGMQSTRVSLTPEMEQNCATGYQWKQAMPHWDFSVLAGMGAVRSTIRDMGLFLSASLGITQSRTTELLQFCQQKQFSTSNSFGVGLGWITSTPNKTELVWHNGSIGGFRCYIALNPKTQRGAVILANSAEKWPDELAAHLLDPDFQPTVMDDTLANSPEYLSRFLGAYQAITPADEPKQEFQIYNHGKLLIVVLPGGEAAMLYPRSFGVFGVKGYAELSVYFTFGTQKTITKIQAIKSDGSLFWEADLEPFKNAATP